MLLGPFSWYALTFYLDLFFRDTSRLIESSPPLDTLPGSEELQRPGFLEDPPSSPSPMPGPISRHGQFRTILGAVLGISWYQHAAERVHTS